MGARRYRPFVPFRAPVHRLRGPMGGACPPFGPLGWRRPPAGRSLRPIPC